MTIYSRMNCPFCQQKTRIYNSRASHNKTQTWRRHKCGTCDKPFTTREKIDWSGSISVASPSGEAPYQYERLLVSIVRASEGIATPVGMVTELTDSIEYRLQQNGFFVAKSQPSNLITTVATSVLSSYNPHIALQYVMRAYGSNPPLELIRSLVEA